MHSPLAFASTALGSSNSTTLANGASLQVSLDTPASGTDYLAGDTVNASGAASVGLGTPSATIVYIVDTSGSTSLSGGSCGTVLACEKAFVIGLNNAAAADGSVLNVGLGRFADSGSAVFGLGSPSDPAFNTGVNGLTSGGGTDFADGLTVAVNYFQQASAG